MHSHIAVAVATAADGTQRGGRTSPGLVLGEDVVELVAPATQTTDVRPLAIAVLQFRLGRLVLIAVVVILLG